nr:MAG TPA: hypothetical protein [Caudoviricetes sp.]
MTPDEFYAKPKGIRIFIKASMAVEQELEGK